MGILTLIFSTYVLALGQQTTTRLDVVYNGATEGRIRGFEQGQPKGNYIDLIWPSSLAANYTLTMPKATTTLLGQINYHYNDLQALPISVWRAHGTEAFPTDISSGDTIFNFVGIGRVGGTWISLGTFGVNYYNRAGVDTGDIVFSTRNAGIVGSKVAIDYLGRILPFNPGQDLGTTGTGYWNSGYFNSGTPLYLDRSARNSAQRLLWTVGNISSADGVWQTGVGPDSSQSQYEVIHNGSLRWRFTELAGIYSSDHLYPQTTNTYSLGSATFQWNNLYVNFIDVEGDIQPKTNNTVPLGSSSLRFSKLWVVDLDCSGSCPGVSPPVDWHLDTSQHVLTLGSHLAGGSFQLLMRHSRGTNAIPTDTLDNDRIGQVAFQLYGGGGYRDAAAIRVEADGTPSGTSSPARVGFFVTPAASTTPVERMFIQQDGETWIRSSMTSDRLLYLQNDSSSGYSAAAFLDHTGNVKGLVGWYNSSAAVHASLFILGTRTNDLVALVQNDTARWTLSSTGFNPATDGGQSIGNSATKPASVTSRSYFTETNAAYGTQQNTFSADANLNLSLVSASSSAATDRASLQFYRYRNTAASPTAVTNGDRLGVLGWQGYTGAGGLMPGAVIEAYVNGTVSSGVLPAEIRFRTTNLSGTLADRAVLNANGFTITGGVEPSASSTYSLGSGSKIWSNVFTNYLTVTNTAGFGVVGHFVPYLDNTNDLGGTSYNWKTVHARNFDAYNEFALISSSITRYLVTASSVATFDGSGNTTFSLNTSSGTVESRHHNPQTDNTYDLGDFAHQWRNLYIANDLLIGAGGGIRAPDNNYGLSYTATVRNSSGTGTCTIVFSAGIATNTTC